MYAVHYADETFLMGDEAVVALLDFAALIADVGQAQQLVIPVIEDDGEEGLRRAVVGPASQILAEPARVAYDEPDTRAFVEELRRRSEPLRPRRGLPLEDDGTAFGTEPEL